MAKFDVAQLQQFFCKAALETYASGQKPIRGADYPWEKKFRIARVSDELTYLDRYVTNGEWSGGETVILVDNVPVWLMQYHGWCESDDHETLTFLKEALTAGYTSGEFHGGRGPEHFAKVDGRSWVYVNRPHGSFENFRGEEAIFDEGACEAGVDILSGSLFWHRYQGILLGESE